MLEDIYKETESRMAKTIDSLKAHLNKIRTGRANPSILDDIRVDYYGQPSPIKQIASVTVPEPNMIVIQPWDKKILTQIEKAISTAELGLNPQNDGNLIRVIFPPLSEERRIDIVKGIKKVGEESKAALRNIRHDENDMVKELEKEKEISEDQMHRALDKIQKITEEFNKKIGETIERKEKEIMEI